MTTRHVVVVLLTLFVTIAVGCGPDPGLRDPVAEDSLLIAGAGATFPAPLYGAWINTYRESHPKVDIRYAAVGSGTGEKWFVESADIPNSLIAQSGLNRPEPSPIGQLGRAGEDAATISFGASDAGLSDEKSAAVERGATIIPVTAGAIVLAYNLPGIDSLQLPRDVYVDIFLGKITEWDDPRIAKANPELNLPDRTISLITRLDSSGTTFAFTHHLAAISSDWRDKHGDTGRKALEWPSGSLRGYGNSRIVGMIQGIPYSIGYAEFGLAARAGLKMARLENKSGKYTEPSKASGLAALETADIDTDLRIPDPPGENAYPIVTFTWLLLYNRYEDPQVATELKEFITWCLSDGQAECENLGYLQLSEDVRQHAISKLDQIGG